MQHHGVPILTPSNDNDETDSCLNTLHSKTSSLDFMHTSKPSSPLLLDCIKQMYSEESALENTTAHLVLEKKKGFNYHMLLRELMYAYITCWPDIGYAVSTLSKFSSASTKYHYKLLKGVEKYLHNTIKWGIWFRCPKHLNHPDFKQSKWYNIPVNQINDKDLLLILINQS